MWVCFSDLFQNHALNEAKSDVENYPDYGLWYLPQPLIGHFFLIVEIFNVSYCSDVNIAVNNTQIYAYNITVSTTFLNTIIFVVAIKKRHFVFNIKLLGLDNMFFFLAAKSKVKRFWFSSLNSGNTFKNNLQEIVSNLVMRRDIVKYSI